MRWELAWDQVDARAVVLSTTPVYVGRGPGNDVVLTDSTVSTRHAALWVDSSGVRLEDLKSRNGTSVNGRPLAGIGTLRSGDRVCFGECAELVVRGVRDRFRPSLSKAYLLVDTSQNIAVPVRDARVRIGPDAEPQLRIRGDDSAEVVFRDDGVWLNRNGDHTLIEPDTPFMVGDHSFVIREIKGAVSPTVAVSDAPFPYVLHASLSGPRPVARLSHREMEQELVVTAGTRVALLWQLMQGIVRDQSRGVLLNERGWCDARDLRVGVWGKAAADNEERLNVLIHRVRKDLEDGGFSGAVIERRQSQVRAYVAEVST